MGKKSIFKSRTFWFNVASTTLEVAQWAGGVHLVTPATIATVTALGNIVLRRLTATPVRVMP